MVGGYNICMGGWDNIYVWVDNIYGGWINLYYGGEWIIYILLGWDNIYVWGGWENIY